MPSAEASGYARRRCGTVALEWLVPCAFVAVSLRSADSLAPCWSARSAAAESLSRTVVAVLALTLARVVPSDTVTVRVLRPDLVRIVSLPASAIEAP
jgi:hypothetical protein